MIMNKCNFFFCLLAVFYISCSNDISRNLIDVNLDARLPLETLNDYLSIDSIIPISSDEYAIFHFDKIIRHDSDIYVLDKTQQAVFKVNTSSKSLKRIVNFRSADKNEYIFDENGDVIKNE